MSAFMRILWGILGSFGGKRRISKLSPRTEDRCFPPAPPLSAHPRSLDCFFPFLEALPNQDRRETCLRGSEPEVRAVVAAAWTGQALAANCPQPETQG